MKFDVIALHPTTECNLNCPMCYRPKETKNKKPKEFFIDLIKELKPYTKQIANGGGEPLLDQSFLIDLGKEIQKNDMIMNVTTNGTITIEPELVPYITMISVSLDQYKQPKNKDLFRWMGYVCGLHIHHKMRVGVNLLMEQWMFEPPTYFIELVKNLFVSNCIERVFALSPKNWPRAPVLEHKETLTALSTIYEHFYVDDLTEKIITEESYTNWKKPCHYGTSMLSIDEQGNVKGCSFAEEPLFTLEKPEDIHKIKDMEIEKRYACPYLQQEVKHEKRINRKRN